MFLSQRPLEVFDATYEGQLRLHSGPAEHIGLKLVVQTHEGVDVVVSKSHEPLSEHSYLSATLLSAAQRRWVAKHHHSHSPL